MKKITGGIAAAFLVLGLNSYSFADAPPPADGDPGMHPPMDCEMMDDPTHKAHCEACRDNPDDPEKCTPPPGVGEHPPGDHPPGPPPEGEPPA